jgi:Helix-turn-helix domain
VFRDFVKTTLSRVVFRNMTSEGPAKDRMPSPAAAADQVAAAAVAANPATAAESAELQDTAGLAGSGGAEADPDVDGRRARVDLTDPRAIRALAHPLRWALLEALAEAGTLTATQASDMLGESPANCAFHLRTLAKYGFVEEAGGGRGRERPWRRTYDTLSWGRVQEDPGATLAAQALDQVWMDRLLTRARRSLTSTASWPRELGDTLGTSSSRLYLTSAEARRLYEEISAAFERLSADREIAGRRHPERRPADAVPVEFVLLGYPVLDSPPRPAPEPPEMSDPRGTMAGPDNRRHPPGN